MTDPAATYRSLRDELETVLVGLDDLVEGLSIALFARGHVLVEGVPGVAKTTAARAFATATGLSFGRVQMTPDTLPADVTGTHIYREHTGEFELQRGPVFAGVVVADEVNRASPKTQSALLESMQEGQVTIGGETLALPDPFVVVATQNPVEREGTFELPVAQRDRFQLGLGVDLPDRSAEAELLDRFDAEAELDADDVESVVDAAAVRAVRNRVDEVYVDDRVKEYVLDVAQATRDHADVEFGASPRASLAFLRTSKARAAIRDRDYVIPDDVKRLAPQVLAHRFVLSADAELGDVTATDVVADVLGAVEPPGGDLESPAE